MRWQTAAPSPDAERALRQKLECASLLPKVLVGRGLGEYEDARRFLTPSLERDWGRPADVCGLASAAEQLAQAVRAGRRITVFGDYDVDGLTATAILLLFLEECGVSATAVIPHRLNEGYGLTEGALKRALELRPELLVTVDCGIAAVDEAQLMKDEGIDLIITDHHEPSGELPLALAVADPKLDAESPDAVLAGAGVALKLVQLAGALLGKPDAWLELVDLAALGTIADVMDLSVKNRALVLRGLAMLESRPRPGLEALLEVCGASGRDAGASSGGASVAPRKPLTAQALAYGAIPRLNAAGRMADPQIGLELLTTKDLGEARRLAETLDDLNSRRRAIELELTHAALQQAGALADGRPEKAAVVAAGEGWHEGVRGIVASRLARHFGLPALVFSIEGETAVGSGRSVGSVNLFKAMESCSELLERFGGHPGAVGATLPANMLAEFERRLSAHMAGLDSADFADALRIDAEVEPGELALSAVRELEMLEPVGHGNLEPCFMLRDVRPAKVRRIGQGQNHLSFVLEGASGPLSAVWFNCPEPADERSLAIEQGTSAIDVAFVPQIDEWRGRFSVKLHVKDVRLASDAAAAGGSPPLSYPPLPQPEPQAINDFARDFCLRHLSQGAALRPAQMKAIENLALGKSTLAVMATGRGKSLIFQIVAAWLAEQRQMGTVLAFPLRALMNDQLMHLETLFATRGIGVAVLSGDTPKGERERVYEEYCAGKLRVLLTTPEYIAFNRQALARAAGSSTGLLVFDEAHHIATSGASHRPAYAQAGSLRQLFSKASVLALSATAGNDVAKQLAAELALEAIVIDRSIRRNLEVADMRNTAGRDEAVSERIAAGGKAIVYVNSRKSAIGLTKRLRQAAQSKQEKIVFYHAGMERPDRLRIEEAFRSGQASCIVATSAFGEGVNIPDIRDIFLYHLPYSAIAFNQMAGRAGRDGAKSTIHLLFGSEDVPLNQAILSRAVSCDDAEKDAAAEAEANCGLAAFESFSKWALEAPGTAVEAMIRGPIVPEPEGGR